MSHDTHDKHYSQTRPHMLQGLIQYIKENVVMNQENPLYPRRGYHNYTDLGYASSAQVTKEKSNKNVISIHYEKLVLM